MKHVLDTDGNGFIDFSTFKDKFGPNMSKLVDVPERELHLPNLVPNIDKINEYGRRSKTLRASFAEVKKGFQPEMDASKYPLLFKSRLTPPLSFRTCAGNPFRRQARSSEHVLDPLARP